MKIPPNNLTAEAARGQVKWVFVDGVPIRNGVEYNIAEGWVDYLVANDAGSLLNHERVERLRGVITVEMEPDA